MSTIHVAMHTWGAWSGVLFFLSGVAYGRLWQRSIRQGITSRGGWRELVDVLSIVGPAIIGLVILISAIFEYTS